MNILSYPICVSRLPVGRHGGCKACGHAPRGAPHQNVPPFQTGGPAFWSQENNRWKPRKLRTVEHVETCLVGFNLINGDSNVETWQFDVIWSSTCWKPMVSLGHHLYECMFKWWFMWKTAIGLNQWWSIDPPSGSPRKWSTYTIHGRVS